MEGAESSPSRRGAKAYWAAKRATDLPRRTERRIKKGH